MDKSVVSKVLAYVIIILGTGISVFLGWGSLLYFGICEFVVIVGFVFCLVLSEILERQMHMEQELERLNSNLRDYLLGEEGKERINNEKLKLL